MTTQEQPTVTVELEHARTLTFALEQAGVPTVSSVQIRNRGAAPLEGAMLMIELAPELGAPVHVRVPTVHGGESTDLGVVDLGAPAYTVAHLAGLGYERDQESEADEAGRALLRGAGISPLAMAAFFERIGSLARPPEILSTHPDPGDRAERARQEAEGFQPRLSLPPPPAVVCD